MHPGNKWISTYFIRIEKTEPMKSKKTTGRKSMQLRRNMSHWER